MKNIFIVILLFSTYCYGQYIPQSRQDTTYTHGSIISEDSVIYSLWGGIFVDTIPIKAWKGLIIRDTTINGIAAKVIEVDTSYHQLYIDTIDYSIVPNTFYLEEDEIDDVFIINNTVAPDSLGITLHGPHRKHELGAILLSYPPIYTCVYCEQRYKIYDIYSGMDEYKDALKKYGERGADSFFMARWNSQDTSCISAEIELNKHKTKQVVKPNRNHRDSLKIVMLVADTSRNRPMNFIKEPAVIGGVTYSETPLVYWTFGYSVGRYSKWRKRWKHSHFLDIHKKPLSVNIFIWQIKQRKQ